MSGSSKVKLEGARQELLEVARNRLMVGVFLFGAAFAFLGIRTLDLGLVQPVTDKRRGITNITTLVPNRGDIVDRNGVVLATNLETKSLYAVSKDVIDPEDAAKILIQVLPELSEAEVYEKLNSGRSFVWIKRHLTPKQMWQVNALGLPGLKFKEEEKRVYPNGSLASHSLGYVDVDGNGIAGIEHFFNNRLNDPSLASDPLRLSIDVRVQHALADELLHAVKKFSAKGAAGVVMDVKTGEVLALSSLPDFDPNRPFSVSDDRAFNRVTKGVYELGSIFKTFTLAQALDAKVVTLNDGYDATDPIQVSRFTIRDNHPKKRYLKVPEIYAYSSNIGAAKMAIDIGSVEQKFFLGSLGFLRPSTVELTEVGYPLFPERWGDISTMTISYGHGIAVSPMQVATAIAAMVNGGNLYPATIVAQTVDNLPVGKRVISRDTSDKMRHLMRLAVRLGTGGNADVSGYRVGGKTGTAEKAVAGGYNEKTLISSFAGVFPMDAPQYMIFVSVDEPQGLKETFNYATAGWVAAPVVRNVVTRIAPLMGVKPELEERSEFLQTAYQIDPE